MLDHDFNRTQYQSLQQTVQHQLLVNECLKASQRPTLAGEAIKAGALLMTKLNKLLMKRELNLQNRTNIATR